MTDISMFTAMHSKHQLALLSTLSVSGEMHTMLMSALLEVLQDEGKCLTLISFVFLLGIFRAVQDAHNKACNDFEVYTGCRTIREF